MDELPLYQVIKAYSVRELAAKMNALATTGYRFLQMYRGDHFLYAVMEYQQKDGCEEDD